MSIGWMKKYKHLISASSSGIPSSSTGSGIQDALCNYIEKLQLSVQGDFN